MREYMNYLSHFYEEGSLAQDLPPNQRVYTEHEMQRALSKALMYHGIYSHLDPRYEKLEKEKENERKKKEVDKAEV
jgi:hypothetical protein